MIKKLSPYGMWISAASKPALIAATREHVEWMESVARKVLEAERRVEEGRS